MIAGVDIKEKQLIIVLACVKCRGKVAFPVSVGIDEAKMKLKTRHGWQEDHNNLYCDGCSDILELDKPTMKPQVKKEVKKVAPKPADDDDGCIEL